MRKYKIKFYDPCGGKVAGYINKPAKTLIAARLEVAAEGLLPLEPKVKEIVAYLKSHGITIVLLYIVGTTRPPRVVSMSGGMYNDNKKYYYEEVDEEDLKPNQAARILSDVIKNKL